jgi:tetratricopeptide (TPR) repeat protein
MARRFPLRCACVAAGVALALTLGIERASAQERPDSGRSHGEGMAHHDDARAENAPRLGRLTFATSATPAAHAAFVRGVLYLHNFHYPQAAAAFREAQALDSLDVMSYWGEAVSYTHPVWDEQDTAAARAALRRLALTPEARLAKARTPRERAWLATAEALYDADVSKARRDTMHTASLDTLRTRYPRDDEAQLFYALSLLGLNQGDRDVPTYLKAYEIARREFRTHPDHPGAAHYLIHSVDDPEHAAMGLDAARAYSRIAPDAGHAQHMTSHIFIALGMWDDVIAANERAQQPSKSGERPPYAHGVQWLIYGYLQEGRYREATTWVDSVRALAMRLRDDPRERDGLEPEIRSYLALDRAACLADTRAWGSPMAMLKIDTAGFDVLDAASNDLAVGMSALERGESAQADSALARMSVRNAQTKTAPDGEPSSTLGYAKVIEGVMRAAVLHADRKDNDAIGALAAAAAMDDSLPFAFGPPVEIISPHELAGEYLRAMGRPADAVREYKLALARAPGRTRALLGLASAQADLGQRAEAHRTFLLAAKNLAHADNGAVPELTKLRTRVGAPEPTASR